MLFSDSTPNYENNFHFFANFCFFLHFYEKICIYNLFIFEAEIMKISFILLFRVMALVLYVDFDALIMYNKIRNPKGVNMRKTLFRGILLAILVILVLSFGSCKRLHQHDFGDWVYTKEPTCSAPGEKYCECECGEKKTVAVAPLGVHELKNNICTMCGKNLNPYFFNLFKSLISEEYPLVIKDLSFTSRDKTAYYSFKNTELIVSASGTNLEMQLIGTCEITKSNKTTGYDFVGALDSETLYARLITKYDSGDTAPHYLALPLSTVEIDSELSSLEENLRNNALLKHSTTLTLLVNSIKEWHKNASPAIIDFYEHHFDDIAPFMNDYFTSLFTVSLVDDKIGLELNFTKIKEFNNSLYNEKISSLYEEITKKPYDEVEGKITGIMNTTIGELLRTAEEEKLNLDEVIQYCFTALYNLRVISSSKIPESISKKLTEEYAENTLLALIAEETERGESEILAEAKSALSKIGELTGYQYIFKLAQGNNYDYPTAEENVEIRDVWNSINSRLISFASFASTTFVTDGVGNLYSFKMTFRAGGSTINIRLDKDHAKTEIPSAITDEINEVTSIPSRNELKALLPTLIGASVNGNILTYTRENVNDGLHNTSYIEEFNLDECIIIYSPVSESIVNITLLGALYELDENGEKLDTGVAYTTLTLVYDSVSSQLTTKPLS